MTLVALDIPDDRDRLSEWLEGQLVGLQLGSLVAELSAVHADVSTDNQSLDGLLGDDLPAVLDNGLSVLSQDRMSRLLRQPALLFELQERVFVEGGTYWDQRQDQSAELNDAVSRGWANLSEFVERDTAGPAGGVKPQAAGRRQRAGARAVFVGLSALALVVLAMFAVGRFQPPGPTSAVAWGWNRPAVLDSQLTGKAYLAGLADAAEEWFDRRPESAEPLAQRILQFRRGCSALILAEHPRLSAEERSWLVGKCRQWGAKLDSHLANVEAGREIDAVLAEMDETVRSLVETLRTGPPAAA